MKTIKRILTPALAIVAAMLVFTSCDHKELCWHHPHYQSLRIVFDWRDAPTASPEGMCVYLFPIEDDNHFTSEDGGMEITRPDYYRFDFSNTQGGVVDGILPGKYRIITYNNDTDGVLFSGTGWETHKGFTREGSLLEPIYGNVANRAPMAPGADDQRVVICPDAMWGVSVGEVEIQEQGVKYTHYPFDPGEGVDTTAPVYSTEHVITLYPHLLTCYYDYEIRNVSNLENSVQMCASLSGMASDLTFSSEELGRELVTIPFAAAPDMSTRRILGNFVTWGHHELNPQPHYLILYVWMKGEPRGWYFTFDVTAQVNAAPDRHYVHLVINNLDLPVIIDPGDEGEDAFEPSVDDWFQENHVVPM